jgi:anti-sigma-K factor RskA
MASEPDVDMTAAELALGVLDGEERSAALRRVLAEPDFARDVEQWRAHFATLFAETREIEPPPHVFTRIEAGLSPRRIGRLVWPAIVTAVAASILIVLALRLSTSVAPSGPASTLVAPLASAADGTPIPAVYDRARAEIRLPSAGLTKAGKSAELWMIGGDGVPHSLGLLTAGERSVVAVKPTDRKAMVPGTKLAVSSEPLGGSPSGKPTGPILAIGTFISV